MLHAIAEREIILLHDGAQPWSHWLTTAARHGRFRFTNTMLIGAQHPDATDVQSYQQWQEHSRQVSRGKSGIRILSRRGLPRTVFDIAQTEGLTPGAPCSHARACVGTAPQPCRLAHHQGCLVSRAPQICSAACWRPVLILIPRSQPVGGEISGCHCHRG
ncbi:ArdC-like ssDNA-binding domain-containing protein [Actinomadura sp. 6N118]|uniref:ArdC-like ssDNA-binding domain-containing protein n=1 Tax=Actinomadura sp. 6N118 TaxID=3375151 RepID=UPI0037A895DC